MEKKPLSITELNYYLKTYIEESYFLQTLWVIGEISNLKLYRMGGHLYFTLSDGESQMNCVMYATHLSKLKFEPKNGITAVVFGKMHFYHKKGTLIFQCFYMGTEGKGSISASFEDLKKKLLAEGLFDEAKKKPIPKYPKMWGL